MKPLVSIIIPLYNSELYITECINSCLKQSYSKIEIIVVDDGSTDNGAMIVENLAAKTNNIKVIHRPNSGVSAARNVGIDNASGDYICFVDADDTLDRRFINVMVGYLEEHKADFCFSKNTCEDRTKQKTGYKIITSGQAEALLLSSRIHVGCWNKMYRRSLLEKNKFREDLFYGEGLYFISQIAHASNSIIVCNDALYHYRRVNPESATTKFGVEKMINGEKSLLEIYKLIKNDGKIVKRAWSQHYCLFCINAIKGILRQDAKSAEYRPWHKKLKRNIMQALLFKDKIIIKPCILLYAVCPKLLLRIKK